MGVERSIFADVTAYHATQWKLNGYIKEKKHRSTWNENDQSGLQLSKCLAIFPISLFRV